MRPVPALLALACLTAPLATAERKEAHSDADPGAEAVHLLTFINFHRSDRIRGDNRVTIALQRKQVEGSLHEWSVASRGTGPSLPPLVFNPALNDAAAKLLATGARATPGQRSDPIASLTVVGYPAPEQGVILLGSECETPEASFYSALLAVIGSIERKGTPSLPLLARTDLLKEGPREVGIATASAKGRATVAIVMGGGSATRHLGGIVYQDINRNDAYDPGEGRGGVAITIGSASTLSQPSGAWWLPIDHQNAGEVRFSSEGTTAVRPFAKGVTTVAIDWQVPIPADLKAADRLLAAAEKATKEKDGNLDKQRGPLVELLVGTRMACLDDERQKRIADLVSPIRSEFQDTLSGVLSAMGEDPATFRKRMSELQKPWKGAIPAWFREAQGLYAVRQKVQAAKAAASAQQKQQAGQAAAAIQQAMKGSRDPAFLEQLRLWQDDMEALTEAEEGGAEKGKAKAKGKK